MPTFLAPLLLALLVQPAFPEAPPAGADDVLFFAPPADARGTLLLPFDQGLVPLGVVGAGPLDIRDVRWSPVAGELAFELVNRSVEPVTAHALAVVRADGGSYERAWEAIGSVPPGGGRLYPLGGTGSERYIPGYGVRSVRLPLASDSPAAALELRVQAAIFGDGSVHGDPRKIDELLATRRRERAALERWLPELRRVLAETEGAAGDTELGAGLAELASRLRAAIPPEAWARPQQLGESPAPAVPPRPTGAAGALLEALESTVDPGDCSGPREALCTLLASRRYLEDVLEHFEERLVVLREHTIAVTTAAPAPGDG